MNIVLNTDQSYKLSELAEAVENASDDLIYIVKLVDGVDVSYAITREQFVQGISGGGGNSKFIISGGVVWSGTGLLFDVSAIVYEFFGTTGNIDASQLTLDDGDSDARFDVFAVDVPTNTVVVIKGIPDANPTIPQVGEDQIFIQATLVGAGATVPTIDEDFVYRDNADWTTSTYTVGSPNPGTVDFESTNDPFQGTFCIESNTSRSTGMRFQRVSSIDLGEFTNLSFRIRFDTALPSNRNLLSSVWMSGSTVGNTVNFMNFGINRNLTGVWQTIVIPTTAYNASNIDRIQIRMDGGTNSQQVEYFLDFIVFSSGILQPAQLDVISVLNDGALVGTRPKLNFIEGTGVTFSINDNISEDRVDITINSTSSGGGIVETVVAGTGISVDATDPANPVVSSTVTPGGQVDSVVAGTNVSVDNTDPANPIVSATDTTDHALLSNLSWTASGHTGTANRVPVFGAGGAAELAQTTGNDSKLVSGTEGTNGNLVEWAASGNARDSGIASTDVILEADITGTSRSYTQGQGFTIEDLTITAGTPNVVNWNVDTSNMKRLVLNADAELQVPTGSLNVTGSIEVENDGGFTLTFAAGLSTSYILGDTPTTTDTEFFLITYEKRGSRIWLVVNNQKA